MFRPDLTIQRPAFQALLAAALFGLSTPVAKALGATVSPTLLAALLYLGSGAALSVWLLVRRARHPAHGIAVTRADLGWLLGSVVVGGIGGPLALIWGLRACSAASASLMLSFETILTALIAAWVFREAVGARTWLAAGLTLVASALLVAPQADPSAGTGALLVLVACLCWALDNNLTRRIAGADAVTIAWVKGLVAGFFNLALALAMGEPWPAWPAVGSALLVGAAGYGWSLVLFILALRHLGSARTAAHFGTAPFIGAGFAVLVMGEPGSSALLGAAVLVAVSTLLVLTERHSHVHAHEPMEHEHPHEHDAHHRHVHGPNDTPAAGMAHTHRHRHESLQHAHPHLPDLHHRHSHDT